jgi:hypothetical protein
MHKLQAAYEHNDKILALKQRAFIESLFLAHPAQAGVARAIGDAFVAVLEAGYSDYDTRREEYYNTPPIRHTAPPIPLPDVPVLPTTGKGIGNAGGTLGNASEQSFDNYKYEPTLKGPGRNLRDETIRFWKDNRDTFPKLKSTPATGIQRQLKEARARIPDGNSYQGYTIQPAVVQDANKTLAFDYGPHHTHGYPAVSSGGTGGGSAGGGGGEA